MAKNKESDGSSHMGTIVDVDFYTIDTLPEPLREEAESNNVELPEEGLIAVKTVVSSMPSYIFERVGSSSEEISAYMAKLSREDGMELAEVVADLGD